MEQEKPYDLVEIVNSLKGFIVECKQKWFNVLLITFIFSIIGLFYSLTSKPKYIASSTMMLESSKSGGNMGGALALASQFGLGGSSSGAINEEKLLEIVKAEIITKTALFTKININSKSDFLANHFMDIFGYKKAWENNDSLKNFRFLHNKENLTVLENKVFKIFYSRILKSILTTEKLKSGIIVITTNSESELFSINFNRCIVDAVTSFYKNRITEKGRQNVSIIQHRVDSIAIALKDAEFALARWKDANFQMVKAQGLIAEMDLRRNVEFGNSIYIEGVKQLEISKFALLQDTPFLQIIDQPSFPIEPSGKVSAIKGGILGCIIGFILSVIYIFVQKKYKDLMLEVDLTN